MVPATGVAGQMYFDQATNKPYFYDGTALVAITQETASQVSSIGGASGIVGLGNGLQVINDQILLSDNILQTAVVATTGLVTRVQGQTGEVSSSGSVYTVTGSMYIMDDGFGAQYQTCSLPNTTVQE